MARRTNQNLTVAELELMNILWEHGPATVQMVVDRLPPARNVAYTTVQTVLNILHRKGKVQRKLKNRAFYYQALVSHAHAAEQALQDMVRTLFGGSPERLVLAMLDTKQITPDNLKNLQSLIEKAEKEEQDKTNERD